MGTHHSTNITEYREPNIFDNGGETAIGYGTINYTGNSDKADPTLVIIGVMLLLCLIALPTLYTIYVSFCLARDDDNPETNRNERMLLSSEAEREEARRAEARAAATAAKKINLLDECKLTLKASHFRNDKRSHKGDSCSETTSEELSLESCERQTTSEELSLESCEGQDRCEEESQTELSATLSKDDDEPCVSSSRSLLEYLEDGTGHVTLPIGDEVRAVQNLCAICLSSYKVDENIVWSSNPLCEHVYHEECFKQVILARDSSCPLCRHDFVKDGKFSSEPATEYDPFLRSTNLAGARRSFATRRNDDEEVEA